MKIIYTSILGTVKTNNNNLVIDKFENTNNFVDNLLKTWPYNNKSKTKVKSLI